MELAKLSILSLFKFSNNAKVILIRDHENYNGSELEIHKKRIRYITIDGFDPAFPKISYKSNCFRILIERNIMELDTDESFVVVDADLLWKSNPDETFEYLKRYEIWG